MSEMTSQAPDKSDNMADRRGFDCEFVDTPPNVLQTDCPICLLIIREPHQVTCCGKKFCQYCIKKMARKPCPTCKAETVESYLDLGLKQSLYSLQVYCSNKQNACEWMGELRHLEAHLNQDPRPEKEFDGCQFAQISCSLKCGDIVQRHYMQKHQAELCPKRPFSCEHCHNYQSTYDDIKHNHWPVCEFYPVHCPNQCGSILQRQNVNSHDCPLTPLSCEFHRLGCAVKLPREDIPKHLNASVHTHMSLLATSHAEQQALITQQQNQITQQQKQIIEQQKQIVEQQTLIVDQQAQIASLVSENAAQKRKNINFEHGQQSLETDIAALKATAAEHLSLEAEVASLKTTVTRLTQALVVQKHPEPRHRELEQSVPGLDEPGAGNVLTLERGLRSGRRPSVPPVPPATPIPIVPVIITMPDFERYKRDRRVWFSPPLYTHPQGYKICLRVDAAGNGPGEGKYVSVHVFFVRGDFDDNLNWPFSGTISIQILDQIKGQKQITKKVRYDHSVDVRARQRVVMAEWGMKGQGNARFVAHSELNNYLHNDSLQIKVLKVKPLK